MPQYLQRTWNGGRRLIAALVAECIASGMTAKEWCRLKGIEYRKYCEWATRVNRKTRQEELGQWADVTIAKQEKSKSAIYAKRHYPIDGIYLACRGTDLRKSINSLLLMVKQKFKIDSFGNYLFLFCNRNRNRLK